MTTTAELERLAHRRGLRIPADLLRAWLVSLVERGWLEATGPDDWQLTPRGRRHFGDLREAHLEENVVRTPPVGAFRRLHERRVEEDG